MIVCRKGLIGRWKVENVIEARIKNSEVRIMNKE
jgi:hypothetical protein